MSKLYLYVLPIILYTYYIASNTMSAFSNEDPYIHIMKPGKVLYHGNLDEEYNIHKSDRIKWFSEDIYNVLQYGYPKKYTVKEPITLIRIDNIPENYFDDDINQNTSFREIYDSFFNTWENGDKCRNSVPDNDEKMAQFLINNGYDGYIMNKMLNCNSFDGGMFHSELAFKDMNKLDKGVNAINEIPKNDGKPYKFFVDGVPYTADEPGMNRFVYDRKQKKNEERNKPSKKKRKTPYGTEPHLMGSFLHFGDDNDDDGTKLSPMGSLFGNDDIKSPLSIFSYDSPGKTGGSNVKRTKKRRKKAKKQNKKTKRKKIKSKRKRIKK